MTTWHVDREMDGGDQTLDCDEGGAARPQYAPSVAGGTQLLTTAASRVWEELYIGKKPVGLVTLLSCSLGVCGQTTGFKWDNQMWYCVIVYMGSVMFWK